MKEYKKVRSTLKPEELIIDKYSVYVNTNIVEIHEEEFDGFEYDMTQYTKDEYIQIINTKADVTAEMLNTMLMM